MGAEVSLTQTGVAACHACMLTWQRTELTLHMNVEGDDVAEGQAGVAPCHAQTAHVAIT